MSWAHLLPGASPALLPSFVPFLVPPPPFTGTLCSPGLAVHTRDLGRPGERRRRKTHWEKEASWAWPHFLLRTHHRIGPCPIPLCRPSPSEHHPITAVKRRRRAGRRGGDSWPQKSGAGDVKREQWAGGGKKGRFKRQKKGRQKRPVLSIRAFSSSLVSVWVGTNEETDKEEWVGRRKEVERLPKRRRGRSDWPLCREA